MAPEDPSELQRAQAALAASEQRLSRVLAGSNDGWWDWDLVVGTLYYSPRWWEMLGHEPDALPADAALWERLLHPDDRAEVDRVFGAALRQGLDRYEVEFRLQHRDGHFVPVLSRGRILRDAGGRPLRVSGTNTDLTARRAAEAAQREIDASQRALLEAMTDGVFVAQAHRFVFANPALPALLGYTAEAFVGLPFSAVVAPDFLALWTQRFDARVGAADEEPPRHYELCFLRRGGERLWVELRASRLFYRGERAVLGIVRDASDRQRAQAEHRIDTLNQRLSMAIHGAGYGVWEFVLASQTLIWDDQMHAIHGHTRESFDGTRAAVKANVHPDDLALVEARFVDMMAGRRVDQFEFRVRRPSDGQLRHIEGSGYLQRDSEGRAQRLVGMNRDVTDSKLAERALRESEERWKFALEGSGDGVWDWDVPAGAMLYSQRWKSMLGHAEHEIGGGFDEWQSRVHPEDLPAARAALRAYVDGSAPGYLIEHRLRCKDGSWKWILSRGLVVNRDADGRPLRLVGTHTDLSERKQAEALRQQLEARLREGQKLEAIGTLAGGVAHDFNNLLAAILGNVALARQDVGPRHPALASLEQIQNAGLRARNLVQQILAFSRRQPQQLIVQPLRPIVDEALALLRATLPAAVAVETRLTGTPLPVRTDATQMQQVLMNLCTNAWHAMQGRPGRIVVGLALLDAETGAAPPAGFAPGRYAHLWIADDGEGMDADCLARIFEPFFTTKPVGQGTGLGLSVVHGIVAAQGGVIGVQSEPGRGSRFDLHFPLAAQDDEPRAAANAGAAPPRGQGQRIVYVDDDEIMLITVERLLQRAGYEVRCYQDGREAVAAVSADPSAVDLVVSDYNMPLFSGLDLARALAELPAPPPVVISSGYLASELRAQARAIGVRALLKKENTVEELEALVQRVLEETRPGART